jgi:Tol biopolymer transport system component
LTQVYRRVFNQRRIDRRMSQVARVCVVFLLVVGGVTTQYITGKSIPHKERWGIYALDLTTGDVDLLYSAPNRICGLHVSSDNTFVFSQGFGGNDTEHEEICTVNMDGTGFTRLTDNKIVDTYPCWSPDGSAIAFLSWRDDTMDVYVMGKDGSNLRKLYDSGYHDGDIHWLHNKIVFTRNSQIWVMDEDGTGAHSITDPPRAGEWGEAVLPFGDYDPRLSPDGTTIAFERLVDDTTRHGNYNIYAISIDGTHERALTNTGYTQGLPKWSRAGDKIVYLVSARGEEGHYRIYVMNADGTNNQNVSSDFPGGFLCHSPIFSSDDSVIYFAGEWWEETPAGGLCIVLGMVLVLILKYPKH